MTKDVLVGISGLQFTNPENADSIETVASGKYYQVDGRHYIKYEESMEGFNVPNSNLIKISDHKMEVTKKGTINVNMVFEENKKNISCYTTPYGNLMIGIEGGPIKIEETPEMIHVDVKYNLDINYEHVANCAIHINVRAKNPAEGFSLKDI